MQYDTYLFDLDGTLVDTSIYHRIYKPLLNTIKEVLKINDEELDRRAYSAGLRKNKYEEWDSGDLCRELGMLDKYYEVLSKEIKICNCKVKEVFNQLNNSNKKIGIVSNSMCDTIQLYLDKFGIKQYVNIVFSSDDARCMKHDELFWKLLIEKEKLEPKKTLIIGDNKTEDIKVPKQFGFKTCQIENPEELDIVLTKKVS